MEKRNYSFAQLGLLFGVFIGGGIATILFATTGNAIYFSIIGVGVAVGLILGAGYDQYKAKKSNK